MAFMYREVQVEDDKSIGDSGTDTVDLNLKDPITSLIVRFKVTNTAALDGQPPQKAITKIELVDGGQVYFSLSGQQAQAASAYGLGRYPHCVLDGRSGNNQWVAIQLLFGRYLGDEEYAFDPSKLLNPQLKVTWAKDTGHTTLKCTLGVTARIMEDLVAPGQALMWKEVEAWTTTSGAVKKIDLPTDYVIRSLMTRAYLIANGWHSIHTHFKLDCDLGKFIPFDLDTDEYQDITLGVMGPFHVPMFGVCSANEIVETWLGTTKQVPGIATSHDRDFSGYTGGFWSWFIANVKDNAGADANDADIMWTGIGYYPENCVLYPFGRLDSPETWFNAREYGEIALKITEGVSSAAGSVCVQQVRPIP